MTIIKISSKHAERDDPFKNNFTIRLPEPIPTGLYRLEQVVMPVAWQNVHSGNNKIPFSIGATDYTAEMRVGEYSLMTLMVEAKRAMNSEVGGSLFDVYVDPDHHGRVRYEYKGGSPDPVMFRWASRPENSARKVLGFNEVDRSMDTPSDNPPDVSPVRSLNIRVDPFRTQTVSPDGVEGFIIPVIGNTGSIMVLTTHHFGEQYAKLHRSDMVLKVEVRADEGYAQNPLDWYMLLRRVCG